MVRSLAIAAVCALALSAQYAEVVTSDDGRQVYFTTQLVLKDSGPAQRPELRLFRVDGQQVQLVAERGSLKPMWAYGSGDGVQGVSVSGDGQILAFTLINICPSGEECTSTRNQAQIRNRFSSTEFGDFSMQISRNGEWAMLVRPPAPQFATLATLVNLRSGQRTEIGAPPHGMRPALASDGSVFVQRVGQTGVSMGVERSGQFTPVPSGSGAIRPLALSDNGRVVVLSRLPIAPNTDPQPRLVSIDLTTGAETALYDAASNEFPVLDGLSNDGQVALVRAQQMRPEGDMYVVSRGRRERVALGANEFGVSGAISGDGSVAVIATSRGRLLRMTLATGVFEEIIPETLSLSSTRRLAPGSLIQLDGTADDWRDRITVNEHVAPVIAAAAGSVWIQFPWEAGEGEPVLRVRSPSTSPLEQKELAFITRLAPSFLNGLNMIRGDWSGMQTTPPGPSDIVHTYMSGLGAVIGEVHTGVPAPLDSLRPIEGTLRCRFLPHPSYADTVWAGLAPGMIGIYQVTFRMPPDAVPVRFTGAQCDLESRWGHTGFSMIGVPLQP